MTSSFNFTRDTCYTHSKTMGLGMENLQILQLKRLNDLRIRLKRTDKDSHLDSLSSLLLYASRR